MHDFQPHRVIFLGDVIDADPISHFAKTSPQDQSSLQRELDTWKCIAKYFLEALPSGCRVQLIPGNHERRILVWQYGVANQALRDLEIPRLLKLSDLGIQYIDQEFLEFCQGTVIVKHGAKCSSFAGGAARFEMRDEGVSGVSGHDHTAIKYVESRGKKMRFWISAGHLQQNPPPWKNRPMNWQQGMALGEFRRGGTSCWCDVVTMEDDNGGKTAYWGGRRFHVGG
jgi:hypothetical protein